MDEHTRSQIIGDFDACMLHLRSVLVGKLAFWQLLPWKMAAIAHTSQSLGRLIAGECLSSYCECEQEVYHHRLTNRVLAQGRQTREELESFIKGQPLTACPALLAETLPLAMIPTTERIIESRHHLVNARLSGKRRKYPTTVSLANRILEIGDRLTSEPGFLTQLAACLSKVRNAKEAARATRILHHPSLLALLEQGGQHPTALLREAVAVLYRTNLDLQFQDHTLLRAQQAAWTKQQAQLQRTCGKLTGTDVRSHSMDTLILQHLVKFLEHHASSRPFLTFGIGVEECLAFSTLEGAL